MSVRRQRIVPDVMKTPAELAQEDMQLLQGARREASIKVLRSLTLKWYTPEWAREDRYKVSDFAEDGSMFIVRPAVPGKDVTRWEAIYNGVRKAWVLGTLWDACWWLEQNVRPGNGSQSLSLNTST